MQREESTPSDEVSKSFCIGEDPKQSGKNKERGTSKQDVEA